MFSGREDNQVFPQFNGATYILTIQALKYSYTSFVIIIDSNGDCGSLNTLRTIICDLLRIDTVRINPQLINWSLTVTVRLMRLRPGKVELSFGNVPLCGYTACVHSISLYKMY